MFEESKESRNISPVPCEEEFSHQNQNSLWILPILLYGFSLLSKCRWRSTSPFWSVQEENCSSWIKGNMSACYISQLRLLQFCSLAMFKQTNIPLLISKAHNTASFLMLRQAQSGAGRNNELFSLRKRRTEKARREIVVKTWWRTINIVVGAELKE